MGRLVMATAVVVSLILAAGTSLAVHEPFLVKDMGPSGGANLLADINGTLVFSGYTSAQPGSEPWKSDGTEAGTFRIKDIYGGSNSSSPSNWADCGGAYFKAQTLAEGEELWKSDGTAAGTNMVRDLQPGWNDGSIPVYMTCSGGVVYYQAQHESVGTELFRSDGTELGTYCVADIWPGTASSYPWRLFIAGGTLFFNAWGPAGEDELWKTNGMASGTVLVRDINPYGSSSPDQHCAVGSILYFSAEDGIHGRELWKSDGTTGGTVMVKDIYTGGTGSGPFDIVEYNGMAFFVAENDSGRALWRSDGTAAGTVEIHDLHPEGSMDGYADLTVAGGYLFFYADEGLWKTDGTTPGTELVYEGDIYTGTVNTLMLGFDGMCYFVGYDLGRGYELWHSDGTEAGTNIVYDFYPGSGNGFGPASGDNIEVVGDRLYVSVQYAPFHSQLWMITDVAGVVENPDLSDGEEAHLGQVRPNPFSSGTTIAYTLPFAAEVRMGVYDVAGHLIATLLDRRVEAGEHSVEWNGCNDGGIEVSGGIYFCRMEAGEAASTRKLVVSH
jgi:ELWxxDGT repeat protein